MSDVLFREFARCRDWIEAALEYSGGTHTFEDIVRACCEGKMQFWPAERGCGVTEVVVYPRKKVLHIFLAGGEMAQLQDMVDSVVTFAKAHGCDAVTVAGRPGWEKVLAGDGFRPVFRVLERKV